jgi:hypothetical protein
MKVRTLSPEAMDHVTNPLHLQFTDLRGQLDELAEAARVNVIPEGRRAVAVALAQVQVELERAETLCARLRVDR